MADEKQKDTASQVLSNTTQTIQNAVKTGKAISGFAKGAATGGLYGAAAMAIWQNRNLIGKIILAASFIIMLPILFILMLPSLIFGGLDFDSSEIPIINNNEAIYANIDNINNKVNLLINTAHTDLLKKIDDEITKQPYESEYEIIDDFDSNIIYNSAVIITQYQAYKNNYTEISIDDLISILNLHKSKLFSYTATIDTQEITTKKVVEKTVTEYIDQIITDANGEQKTIKIPVDSIVEETVDSTEIKIKYIYTVTFIGIDYFADKVFSLTPEEKAYAEDLANNLAVFLNSSDINFNTTDTN